MVIKEAVFKKVRKTVTVRVSDEVNGCDCCRRKIAEDEKHLRVQVFNQDEDGHTLPSEQLDFCSWKCVLKYLPKINSNYFVSLPYLHYDLGNPPGCGASDLLKLLKAKK